MDATLNALGGILLKAIPTLLLVLLIHFYLKRMFFRPLEKVLHQRYEAGEGTRLAAQASLEAAGKKAAEYEAALRQARGEIYKEQESQRRRWRDEQAARVQQARADADAAVKKAREALAGEVSACRQALAAQANALAGDIVRIVIQGRG